jgi:hypothetical protein
MSAFALPINELIPMVDQAKEQTKRVVVCSRTEHPDKLILWRIAWKTLELKGKLANVASKQEQVIAKLVGFDFSTTSAEKMKHIATSIDELVADEKDLLNYASRLGVEIRYWWNTSLVKIASQVDHLASISESLHLECDDGASTLIGIAVERFAVK